jgi:hypothetical protein
MASVPLSESGKGVVAANGRGIARVQPMGAFERWEITRINVQNSGDTLVPTCRVYRGSEAASNMVAATSTGTLDTSNENDLILQSGQALVAVWEGYAVGTAGADVGSTCILNVEGTKHIGVR